MKNIYKLIILFIAFCSANAAFSQKTLRLRVSQVTSVANGHTDYDCDGVGDSDWQWTWEVPSGTQVACEYNSSKSAQTINVDKTLWGTNTYYSRECWPTSNVSVRFRYQEDDNTFGNCDASGSCSRTDNWTPPVYNAANNNYQQNGSSTGSTTYSGTCSSGCGRNFDYGMTGRWEVGGSNFDAPNLDGSGYVANKTCGTAIDIDGGTEATGTRFSNHANQCTEVWYVYDVTSTNLTSLTFNNANGTVTVYSGTCSGLCTIGSGSNGYTVSGPVPPGRYYIRISANGGRTNLNVSKTTGTNNNNYIAAASNLGTMPGGGGTLATNTDNFGSDQESGEPGLADNHTDWFYFNTGASVPSYVDIKVDGSYGSSDLDADFRLWSLNDNTYTFPRSCVNWSKLTDLGDGDGDNNVACRVDGTFESSLESYRRFCLSPNTKYYIQVAGWRNNDLWPCDYNEWEGDFRLTVVGSTTPKAPDNICDATSITTNITTNYNSGNINFNNTCNSIQSGEPRTTTSEKMYNTGWWKITTGATNVPAYADFYIEENGGGANNSAIAVYESSGSCTFASLSEQGFNWWCNSDGGSIRVCLKPNKTYFIQAGTAPNSNNSTICTFSSESTGNYYIRVETPSIEAGPDKICDAIDLGTAPYGGPLSNTTNVDLFITNQTNYCASSASGEPDGFPAQDEDKTVWYKFTTPPAYYPSSNPLSQLPHLYEIEARKIGGATASAPTVAIWEETTPTTRTCSPENYTNSFTNLSRLDYAQNIDFVATLGIASSDIDIEYLCLKPSTTYYIQVDHTTYNFITPGGEYVNFSLRVKKDAFRAADNMCDAYDLGIITSDGTPSGTPTGINWTNSGKLSAAPMFSLPHTNKCTSGENGEPNASPGGPSPIGGGGTHSATTWYKFTTGNTVADWVYWYNSDETFTDGNRGSVCIGAAFNSRVTFYTPEIPTPSCPVPTQLVEQPEMNVPGDFCDATLGTGFGAPCFADLFRLKCPRPNTTYYVQIKDASISICYEGVWYYDNSDYNIKTAPTLGGSPINDSICNAIDLGTVPNGGQLAPSTIYDNFCATPDYQWRGDFTQDLEADVWFKFKPPLSGSVIITAQSAPSGSPGIDDDLDLQMAIWEPILGNPTDDHCDDPRYLWTPIIAQDHGMCELSEYQTGSTNCFLGGFTAYDIYETCGNSVLCNENNSLVATCLDPNKYYFIQVDGGDYALCDLVDAGDCVMGYFKLQVKDANLGIINSSNLTQNVSPYTAPSVRNYEYLHDEPCYAQPLPVTAYAAPLNWTSMTNRCATSIGDPIPAEWESKNSSTDKTVWARFVAPPSGKVKVRAENISQIKGNSDYHENINLQLAVYQTSNCFDRWRLTEVGQGGGFDGIGTEIDPLNEDDYVRICVTPSELSTCGFDEYMVVRCLNPGETYYIMIDGDAGYVSGADVEDIEGEFRISVQEIGTIPASSNDAICDAYDMESGGIKPSTLALNASYTTPISFNNECATIDTGYEAAGRIAREIEGMLFDFDVEHTLWFKFKAPSSGKVKIEAINDGVDDIDLGLAIFDIPSQNCNHIQSQGYKFNQDYDPAVLGIADSDDEEITVTCLTPNKWYWIQVDGNRNVTTCGPIGTGTDCETGQFKVKITHLPSDPTYADNVDYTPNPDLAGGNNDYCQAHRVRGASGSINIFNNATYLHNGETITFRHNNRCATTEVNEPELNGWDLNPFDSDNTPTVWYVFNTGPIIPPLLPGEITINVTNPSGTCFDPDMDLYEYTGPLNAYYTAAGCTSMGNNKFTRLFRVGEGSNIPYLPLNPRHERITLSCPKPMTTYLLRVAGSSTCPLFGDNMGDFDINISMNVLPGLDVFNDDICGADNMGTLPSGGSLTKGGNNFCATQQQNEPNTDQGCVQSEPCADETVWFKFKTSSTPGDVQIVVKDVLSLGYIAAPTMAVYRYVGADNSCTANPFNNLAKLDENSGVVVLAGVTVDSAKVTIPCARPNATYYVQVDGIDMALLGFSLPGSTDNFAFNLQVRDLGNFIGRAPNDNLANALPIDSTIAPPTPYILPAGGSISIKGHNRCATCENSEDGDYCGNDESGHTASFNAEDETVWYYFTTPPNPGKITIHVADDPAISGTFSPSFRLYYYNQSPLGPTYRVTSAPSRKIIQEGSTSSSPSTAVQPYTSETFTCLLPNTKYYIQIDGNDNMPLTIDQGDFILTVSDDNSGNPGPSNDLICNAETISTTMASAVNKTNKCSWEETGEPNTSNNMGGTGDDVTSNDYDETVWFTFVPPTDRTVRLQLDVTSGMLGGINYVLYEMPSTSTISCSGTPADIPDWSELNEIASGSSTLLVGNEIDESWPCLSSSKRYYLQIDGNDLIAADDVGNFNIQLTSTNETTPINDDICGIGATYNQGNFGTFAGSGTRTATNQNNKCATQEVNEPETNGPMDDITHSSYDHTLWYKFVASNTDGSYQIRITNNGGPDPINGYIGLFRQNDDASPVCPSTTWNRMSKIKETSSVKVTNDATLDLECWEIEEGKTYYFQVQGLDAALGGDVGTDFNVSVQFTTGTTNPADNICTAPTVTIGNTVNADNRCATTETNEPNVSPMPQSPFNGKDYDETLWYRFTAPASGEVRLSLSSFSPALLSVNMRLYEIPTGYNCASNKFGGLIPNESSGFLSALSPSTDFRCLAPGREYFIQFDGNDAPLVPDRGTWDFVLTDLRPTNVAPANDEPCNAIDVTSHIRGVTLGPCSSDGQYYTNSYSLVSGSPNVDQATKTFNAIGCDGNLNCNDYWFKFTVPLDATGIRIQGNDEYGSVVNNSKEVLGVYRSIGGCGGTLQQINCGVGGFNSDVDYTIGAFPGETLYLQVFDADAPADPARPVFGFCLSVDCPSKTTCGATQLTYDGSQCWNMNTNGTTVAPMYYECVPGANQSTNYFTFSTDCDGTPVDTVSLIFSVTNMGCGVTAMSMYRDNTPCDGSYEELLVNCAVFEEVTGGTTATNFFQTYILPACNTYVMQIISDENTSGCASGGQILVLKDVGPPTTVLPIELLSFTGYNDRAVNVLNWVTSSEVNSLKFEIEKSLDGSTFEYIGEVMAAGNSTAQLDYSFIDEYPQLGDNYYRLKMIDKDGKFKYSELINIRVKEDNSVVKDGIVKIYPNPTNGMLNVQYQASSEKTLDLSVFDVTGRTVLNRPENVKRGMNIIQINAHQFSKAMYILNLLDSDLQESHQAKFIKE